jgi:hypothetical protein
MPSEDTQSGSMQAVLTFIIPVRHPDNTKNWAQLRQRLQKTAASVAQQTRPDWRAVVVSNVSTDLPRLPPGFEVCWVDFPPNPLYERQGDDLEAFYEAVRFDKGRRILAGMLHVDSTCYFMVVDDDDFISNRLTEFVAAAPHANGWYIRDGYVWSGGKWLYLHNDFSNYCGTSHIIRADLLHMPSSLDVASDAYIRRTLGSHLFIERDLAASGTPLAPLPFPGAIYRTGHIGSHSRSTAIFRHFFLRWNVLRNPLRLGRRLLRLRLLDQAIHKEFLCARESVKIIHRRKRATAKSPFP